MTCRDLGIIGKIVDRATPGIVQGANFYLVAQMIYKGTTEPYSFENFAGATAQFAKTDGSVLSVTGSLEGAAALGKVRVSLSTSDTADLASGDERSMQLLFEDDRGTSIILFDGKIPVYKQLFT